MDRLLTPNETSKILQIGYRKVLDLIKMGDLTAYKIGGLFRIPQHALYEYLEKSKYKSYWKK